MPSEEVVKAIERFNELRSPEATARLLGEEGSRLTVEVSGPFCASCGLYDYFDDLAWELRDSLGAEVEVLEVQRVGPESYVAIYEIRGQVERSSKD